MPEDQKPSEPITKSNEVRENNDPHIDQDMPGFPHGHSSPEKIKDPIEEEKTAPTTNNEEK
ncbi:MAG TPA: hypothetical protein PK076_07290 [Saprospiraceae bacterium]|nr:hypothetical protein [Saprospiraceae bacterium]HQW55915.1 hypothetical protein [Saprospiraceae bacterium]